MYSIRPKGILYITYTLIKYIFLIGLLSCFIFSLLYYRMLNGGDIRQIIDSIILIVCSVVVLALICLQTREIIRYKIVIFDDKLWIAANRDLFLTRHKDITIQFRGITTVQYIQSFNPESIPQGMFFFFGICIKKNIPQEEYILTNRFSKKQSEYILQQIASFAEKQNGYLVEILSPILG